MSRILLDLDGTLCPGPYTDRFECNGEPTPEAVAFVAEMRNHYWVGIFTARLADTHGRDERRIVSAIQAWCRKHFGGWHPEVTATKHPGIIIDDSAIGFRGLWPTLAQVRAVHDGQPFLSPAEWDAREATPATDWRQTFIDAMDWVDEYYGRYRKTLEHPALAADYREIQRLRALRDAAKGDKTDA